MKSLCLLHHAGVIRVLKFFLSAFVCSQCVIVFAQSPIPKGNGKVIVTVRDASLFRDFDNVAVSDNDEGPPTLIFLQKKDILYKMDYKESGRFETNIPQGAYDITLKMLDKSSIRYHRANIYVRPGQTNKISIERMDIEANVCDKEVGFIALTSGYSEEKAKYPLVKYDFFLVNRPYKMVVKYCGRTITKDQISYKYVYLTYKNLTVYAERATLKTKTFSFRASGNAEGRIEVSTGNCLKKGKNVVVSLRESGQSEFACRNVRFY